MILNRNSYVRLTGTYNIDRIEQGKSSTLPDILPIPPGRYWYVEFEDVSPLKLLPGALSPNIIHMLINTDLKLILANIHEAYHRVVEEIYKTAVIHLGIPEDKIIFVTESGDATLAVKKYSEMFGKKEIKVIWSRIFEYDIHNYRRGQPSNNITLEDKPYEKKFLNFNRRWRLHRPTLVALLKAQGLLDQGYVSMAPSDDNFSWSTIWPNIIHYHSYPYNQDFPEIVEILKEHETEILNLPPMYIDTDELIENKAIPLSSTDMYYSNTYFSVVSETNFYTTLPGFESGRFFSEKTFKPILERHPFILVAPPHSLDLLRRLGYRTFSSIINETYDIEPNDFRRLSMITNEIKRLCNLNPEELRVFLEKAREICEFNYQCLQNKNYKKDFAQWLIQ